MGASATRGALSNTLAPKQVRIIYQITAAVQLLARLARSELPI